MRRLLPALALLMLAPAVRAEEAPVSFLCEMGVQMQIRFAEDQAVLTHAGQSVTLDIQRSGSGFAYAGAGHALRGKGSDVTWTDAAGQDWSCRGAPVMQGEASAAGPEALSSSRWRLAYLLDGTPEGEVPPRLEGYTAEFRPDGTLAMRLDCNSLSSQWTATANVPAAGTLELSPGRMTRAFCGEQALDGRIASILTDVTGWSIADGQLEMLTADDSRRIVWDPLP
ncbi:META domain-containing protein [Oceanicola sp. S124]|uniref:META domain-containing protein n=1 Tax=Oceanicola sp. S124 TaxID=1042378 RepID=UPI0002558A18|nr:META domain-containing protein [Oceanicola sp. S124]